MWHSILRGRTSARHFQNVPRGSDEIWGERGKEASRDWKLIVNQARRSKNTETGQFAKCFTLFVCEPRYPQGKIGHKRLPRHATSSYVNPKIAIETNALWENYTSGDPILKIRNQNKWNDDWYLNSCNLHSKTEYQQHTIQNTAICKIWISLFFVLLNISLWNARHT